MLALWAISVTSPSCTCSILFPFFFIYWPLINYLLIGTDDGTRALINLTCCLAHTTGCNPWQPLVHDNEVMTTKSSAWVIMQHIVISQNEVEAVAVNV